MRELDGRSTSHDDDDGLLDLVSISLTTVVPRETCPLECVHDDGGRDRGGKLLCIEGRGRVRGAVGSLGRRGTRGGIMVKQ